ncbi:hypothetical protein CCMA1212_005641 [Trichoderma ghanense]|uniref:Uncharacterized protein n=1 Tax=Trichoderma ghanense TaxID=65468 RepID=A0ABY2H2Q3_9HYPO
MAGYLSYHGFASCDTSLERREMPSVAPFLALPYELCVSSPLPLEPRLWHLHTVLGDGLSATRI